MMNKIYTGIIYAGLTVLMVFAPLARGATTTRLWAITIVMFVMYTVVFAGLLKKVDENKKLNFRLYWNDYRQGVLFPVLMFVGISVLSFVFSIYKHESFYALLRLLGYVGLYYVIVTNCTKKLLWYLVGVAICMGLGLSVYGLLQYFGLLANEWWEPKIFLSASYVNHNHFAGYLEMVIPAIIGLMISIKKRSSLFVILFISLVIMFTAFIFAQSRSAWICLAVSLLLMNIILIRRKILKTYSIVIFITFVAVVFSYSCYSGGKVSQRAETMVNFAQGDTSIIGIRTSIWQGTVKMIADNPWTGVGIGCFEWDFPKYRPELLGKAGIRPTHAENDYLHMASELGIFGLIFMVWILTLFVSRGIKSNGIMLGCGIGLLSLSLHGLVDFNFHIPANMILFIALAGLVNGDLKC